MKFHNSQTVVADVTIFLFTLFGGLIYLSPWYSIPAVAILGAWVFDRVKAKVDIVEAISALTEAKRLYAESAANELASREVLAKMQTQVDNLRAANTIRFGAK